MEKKLTGDIVLRAIRDKGIEKVRKIVYSDNAYQTHEATAISLFVDSRMFKDEILKKLSN